MPFKFYKIERNGVLDSFYAYDPECDWMPKPKRNERVTAISAEEYEALIIAEIKKEGEALTKFRRNIFSWVTGLQPTF
jgi:hypothetical protein